MIQALEDQIFRRAAPRAIRHLGKPDLDASDPVARAVLRQARVEFQVAPPLTIHLGDPQLLAGVWRATREAYVVDASQRVLREAVAWGVSDSNECPYCVTVHAGMYESAGGDRAEPGGGDSPAARARAWAAASGKADAPALDLPGLTPAQRVQVLGTAAVFHYVNRMVSVFLGDSPVSAPGTTTSVGQRLVRTSFRVLGRRMAAVDPDPGKAAVTRDAPLPEAFAWAEGNPFVAASLAHFADAAQAAGRAALPDKVRDAVSASLARWQGEAPPLSRAWLEQDLAALPEALKPVGRLTLLAARAAWQVDDALVDAARQRLGGDTELMQAVAWGSFAATQRMAGWWRIAS